MLMIKPDTVDKKTETAATPTACVQLSC